MAQRIKVFWQDKQYIRLVCGHKPSKLRLSENTGYCPQCLEWQWIDQSTVRQREA